jgi:threonine dehydrogenase-like Zn-dependent dehydrogenase
MRQLTFVEPHIVEWREVADAVLQGDGDALVRPIVVANCDLDGLIISGRFPVPGPFALGHEFIAEVVAVGDAVSTVTPGDTVVVPFQVSCGACDRCAAGLTGSCRTVKRGSAYGLGPLGRGEWGGALSDIVRVPYADAMLLPLGNVDPLALASASDNIPDAYRTVAGPLQEHPGATVLIVANGYGSIPLYAAGIASALGAGQVDYVDTSEPRLALAQRLGAQPIEGREAVGRNRYPIVVDCSLDPAGLAFCLRHVEPGGICTSISIYLEDVALPMREMYTTGVTFRTGRVDARPIIPDIVDLVATDRFRPQLVTTTVVGWEDAPAAMLDLPTKLVFSRV